MSGCYPKNYERTIYWENLPPVSIALVPEGVRLRFSSLPDRSSTIERAPAATGPWTALHTQIAPASGLVEHLDALPPPGPVFSRTVQP